MLEFFWSAILAKARSLHHQDGWFVYTTNERCWKCHGYIVFHNLLRVQAKVWVSLEHNFGISQMSHGCCCNLVECWARLSRLSWICQSVTCQVRSDDHNMSAHCSRVFLLLNKRSVCQLRSDDCANPLYISLLLIRLWRWGYKFSRKASCMLVSILYLSCVQNTISRGSVNIGLDDVVKTIVLQSEFSTALWVRSINCTSRRWPAFWHTCL
jgi:hypothetical protein